MGAKYLGKQFDIHGGGMDLLFPHHESEIAQSVAANGKQPVKYWMHNNMITLNGQKMGKSLGNAVSLEDFFKGSHKLIEKPYSPMTIRFFILQAHYRSTLDFSNEALQAAEKGINRLFQAMETLDKLQPSEKSTVNIKEFRDNCYEAMNDDFNSPGLIAQLFDGVKTINSVKGEKESLIEADIDLLKSIYHDFVYDVLGLKQEEKEDDNRLVEDLMQTILGIRQNARTNKDYATSDLIRDNLAKIHIQIKDTKDGAEWSFLD
jgi:cysteinyl-tRNA synthetase